MIWLTWQQHRKQVLFALIALALLAAVLLPTGWQMHRAVADAGLATCRAQESRPEFIEADKGPTTPQEEEQDCGTKSERFNARFGTYTMLLVLFMFLPVLFGFFFGAPLVARELEHGTHRLIWTQGVTRRRWAIIKVTLVGGSALAIAAAYTALVSWWSWPLALTERNQSIFSVPLFDTRGVTALGYTAFAVALGILAGTILRKTLPAMAALLVAFITVRTTVTAWARPQLLPAQQRQVELGNFEPNGILRGDWVLAGGVYDPARHTFLRDRYLTCPPELAIATDSQGPCGYPVGAVNLEIYQPYERLWLFQALETGLYLALAIALTAIAIHQIHRRIT